MINKNKEDDMCTRDKKCSQMEDWWQDRNVGQKIGAGLGFGLLGVGFMALLGWVTMALWNWLMPEIFGLKTLDYWQTWGLLILSFILFKHWGSGEKGGRGDRKRRRHLRQYMAEDDLSHTEKGPKTEEQPQTGAQNH